MTTAPQVKAIRGAQRAITRRKIALGLIEHQRREAESTGASPLRLLRLSRGLSVQDAAYMAIVAERTWRRAEVEPKQVSAATWARIARSLSVPVDQIKG